MAGIGLVLFCLLGIVFGVVLPPGINLCQFKDSICLENSINTILKEHYGGIKELNLESLDPLKIDSMVIEENPNSPIKIAINMTDSLLFGFRNMRAFGVKGFGSDLNEVHEIHFKAPVMRLIGTYSLQGQFLILPILGTGKGNISLLEPVWSLKFRGKSLEKDGNIFLKIKKIRIVFDSMGLKLHFDNLFNGDKVLGDDMNRVLNENWKEVYSEVKKPVIKSFQDVYAKTIQNVFDTIPYNRLFKQ